MTIAILSLMILGQIALFQFLAALANRSIMRQEFRLLEDPPSDRLTAHVRRAPVFRIGLGVILGGLVLLPLTGYLADPLTAKLLLVGISLTSAVAFALANARDREMMRLLADLAPGGSVRRASLEHRSLRQYYHPLLEVIPILIFVATLIFLVSVPGLVSAGESMFTGARTHILALFGLQAVLVFGALYYAQRRGVNVNSMATYIPSLRQRPEVALRLGKELAGTQIRFFIFARIGIAALLGLTIVGKVLVASGDPSAFLWSAIRWGLFGVLLIGFLLYLKRVGRVSRRMQEEMEVSNHEAASAG
jgi:hypothetical protein